MTTALVELVPATAAVATLDELEPLARAIFGEQDRPAGWFRRKLVRECVEAGLSQVAVDPRDGARLGYVLVGTPPSLAPSVRTAGTGVVGTRRGEGIGARLLAAAATAATAAGYQRLRLPAEAALRSYYMRLGFEAGDEHLTLVAFGQRAGAPDPQTHAQMAPRMPAPEPWEPSSGGWRAVAGWLEEAWERTPASCRTTLRDASLLVHASKEGRAWVIHRVLAPPTASAERIAAALDGMLARFSRETPVCLANLAASSAVAAELLRSHGWAVAQRSFSMSLSLTGGTHAPTRA